MASCAPEEPETISSIIREYASVGSSEIILGFAEATASSATKCDAGGDPSHASDADVYTPGLEPASVVVPSQKLRCQ